MGESAMWGLISVLFYVKTSQLSIDMIYESIRCFKLTTSQKNLKNTQKTRSLYGFLHAKMGKTANHKIRRNFVFVWKKSGGKWCYKQTLEFERGVWAIVWEKTNGLFISPLHVGVPRGWSRVWKRLFKAVETEFRKTQ